MKRRLNVLERDKRRLGNIYIEWRANVLDIEMSNKLKLITYGRRGSHVESLRGRIASSIDSERCGWVEVVMRLGEDSVVQERN